MKMKRLLVELSVLASLHVMLIAIGATFFEELFKPDSNRLVLILSAIVSMICIMVIVILYTRIFYSTPPK